MTFYIFCPQTINKPTDRCRFALTIASGVILGVVTYYFLTSFFINDIDTKSAPKTSTPLDLSFNATLDTEYDEFRSELSNKNNKNPICSDGKCSL
uniref:Transmembrane protein n=1 Tax=Parastrongyloides trichosuri TaxID=131310 RepID=A0A0N5A2W8_PARTI